MARITFGVFGYGRGHATRAAAILQTLKSKHELLIFAGDDAYNILSKDYTVYKLPTLTYKYKENGRISVAKTLTLNFFKIMELVFWGINLSKISKKIIDFHPDFIISDGDPVMAKISKINKIPRIQMDHFSALLYCSPDISGGDNLKFLRDKFIYNLLIGKPDKILVSSFYEGRVENPKVKVVPPVLRDEVFNYEPREGDHLLVYLNKGKHQFLAHVELALVETKRKVTVYGTGKLGVKENIIYKNISDEEFLSDMSSCKAIISTAGNQLIGEAVYFKKPILVIPEDSVEQRVNASELAKLGIGLQSTLEDFSADTINQFLKNYNFYRLRIEQMNSDGREVTIKEINKFAESLRTKPKLSGKLVLNN